MASGATFWSGSIPAAAATLTGAVRSAVAAIVPASLQTAFARDPRDLIIRLDANGRAALETRSGLQLLAADATADLRRYAGLGAALTITVPPTRALVRTLTLPEAAAGRLDDVLALDLERATPFSRTDVLAAHQIESRSTNSFTVAHLLTKRSPLTPLLDAATRAGVPVKAIHIADGPYKNCNLLPLDRRRRSTATRFLRTATGVTAGALVGLALGVAGITLWHQSTARTAAETEQAALTARIAGLRRETQDADRAVQEARFARQRRLDTPTVTSVLEEMTRRLPNGTWLTDFRVDEAVISLEGQSTNAADLVALLSRSPLVAAASFTAPITRDPQRGTERFQIRLTRAPTAKVIP